MYLGRDDYNEMWQKHVRFLLQVDKPVMFKTGGRKEMNRYIIFMQMNPIMTNWWTNYKLI